MVQVKENVIHMAAIKKKTPSIRAKRAFDKALENGGIVSSAMLEAGYSPAMAKNPQKLTSTIAWQQLMEEYLSDDEIAEKHQGLLRATRLDHQVFALGPRDEEDKKKYIARDREEADKNGKEYREIDYVTDEDIREMLAEINCKVRRIVHRETARDVYFWVADNKSRKDAIDMAYKLKGSYAPEKSIVANFELNDSKREKSNSLVNSILGD